MQNPLVIALLLGAVAAKTHTLTSDKLAQKIMMAAEYELDQIKRSTEWLSMFQGPLACNVCSTALNPIDKFLQNQTVQ
jgi:hypothetical protein